MIVKKQLLLALAVIFCLSICFGILVACDNAEHTHSYTQWSKSDIEHWKVCPEDNEIDESTRANHSYGADGKCECGASQSVTPDPDPNPDPTPDPDPDPHPDIPNELDDREFYIVGGGVKEGSLANGSWSECLAEFKFTKAAAVDENGITVYTITLTLYSGDTFKIIQPTTIDSEGNWDDSTVLGFSTLANPTGTFTESTGGNIVLAVGADGRYELTIRTTKGGTLTANKVEFKLIESVPSLDVLEQYEMYLVGSIASKPTTQWPSANNMTNIPSTCYRMELQADGKTFSVEVVLGTADRFKVWNYKLGNTSAGYYPDGMNNDLKVSVAGTYVVSWVIGTNTVSVVAHEHRYTEWGKSETEHWLYCATDGEIDENTRSNHSYDATTHTCECGAVETTACAHENPGIFKYTADTVPMPVADGSTLALYCPDCGAKLETELTYKKGFEQITDQSSETAELDGAGTYYAKTYSRTSSVGSQITTYSPDAYVGFQVTKAGTYTITLVGVYGDDIWALRNMSIDGGAYQTSLSSNKCLIVNGKWSTITSMKNKAAKFDIAIDGFAGTQGDYSEPLKSITFTITDENIAEFGGESGTLYVKIGFTRNGSIAQDHDGYFLINLDVQEASATEVTAEEAVEVAMLPRNKQLLF